MLLFDMFIMDQGMYLANKIDHETALVAYYLKRFLLLGKDIPKITSIDTVN
jgi:hypothetical protein